MRIGVFGGSFDPVHLGHLIVAEQCREQAKLDRVLFVPAARPPHKPGRVLAPFHHRADMLLLAISGNPAFAVEELEKDRPGPSYTVDTLAELKRREPDAELHLIIGSDTLNDLHQWRDPKGIISLAGLLIVGRPDALAVSEARFRQSLGLGMTEPLHMETIRCPLLEIASSDIRLRLGEGRSVRYLISRAVEAYLEDKGLYHARA
ncbi:MAG: nicotinate-nucleotide adenylyltransferase [Gemmataceae bacterium]|nr:nicotinate-nucleotide adenylyltransferase [Gemmataceae bacterium]